ncbi:hypothetical protein N431DRAFT_241661 [Stipitochalara longipes BDJ]|nr:hypothetical protein N431DRAFT_241661 [Stipitochalara longipes BDJ]
MPAPVIFLIDPVPLGFNVRTPPAARSLRNFPSLCDFQILLTNPAALGPRTEAPLQGISTQNRQGTVVSGIGIRATLEKPIYQAIHVRYSRNNQANLDRPSSSLHKKPCPSTTSILLRISIRKLHAMCKPHCPSRKSNLLPLYTPSYSNGAAPIVRLRLLGERGGKVYLDESNVCGLLSEALTANVQAILADQTSLVSADTAISQQSAPAPTLSISPSPPSIMNNCHSERTKRELPCHRFLGASSRQIRETCLVDCVRYLDLEIRIRLRYAIEKGY